MVLGSVGISSAWTIAAFVVALGIVAYFNAKNESAKQAKERVGDAKDETDHWRSSFQAEKVRADGLLDELKSQREKKHVALNELAAERMKTDLTSLMQLVADSFEKTNHRFEIVERRMDAIVDFQKAQTKAITEATTALQKIVDRLEQGGH